MSDLVNAIDNSLAFLRAHSELMTRAEMDEFYRLADRVYDLARPVGLLFCLPQVSELLPQLESDSSLPLPPAQFESELHLPGDWVSQESANDGDSLPHLTMFGELPSPPEKVFLVCASPRWFTSMERLRRAAQQVGTVKPPTDTPQEPPTPRLTVDLRKETITLDGQTYDVPSESALRWVKVLVDHAGEWISGPELKEYDDELDGCRSDRLKKHLPDAVLELIDSDPGKGSRLRLA